MLDVTTADRFLTKRDMRQRVPVSDMTFWRWVRDGKLPQPVKMNGRCYWSEREINEWQNSRLAERVA